MFALNLILFSYHECIGKATSVYGLAAVYKFVKMKVVQVIMQITHLAVSHQSFL